MKRRIDGLLEASGWCRDRLLWAFFAKSISNIKSLIIIIKHSHGSLSLYHHHPHFLERIDHRNLVGLATRSPRDPFSREKKKKKNNRDGFQVMFHEFYTSDGFLVGIEDVFFFWIWWFFKKKRSMTNWGSRSSDHGWSSKGVKKSWVILRDQDPDPISKSFQIILGIFLKNSISTPFTKLCKSRFLPQTVTTKIFWKSITF